MDAAKAFIELGSGGRAQALEAIALFIKNARFDEEAAEGRKLQEIAEKIPKPGGAAVTAVTVGKMLTPAQLPEVGVDVVRCTDGADYRGKIVGKKTGVALEIKLLDGTSQLIPWGHLAGIRLASGKGMAAVPDAEVAIPALADVSAPAAPVAPAPAPAAAETPEAGPTMRRPSARSEFVRSGFVRSARSNRNPLLGVARPAGVTWIVPVTKSARAESVWRNERAHDAADGRRSFCFPGAFWPLAGVQLPTTGRRTAGCCADGASARGLRGSCRLSRYSGLR